MSSKDVIKRIFQNALGLNGDYEINDSMAFENVPGWDSFGHMRIVAEIEDFIGQCLEMEEIVGLDTVGKIRDLINTKKGLS